MIQRVGAVIVRGGRLLVLKKRGLDTFIPPGGEPEPGENPEETLRRELLEELGVGVVSLTWLGTFRGEAAADGKQAETQFFLTEVAGEPKPRRGIEGLEWIDRDYARKGIKIGPLFQEHVVPSLIMQGKLESER